MLRIRTLSPHSSTLSIHHLLWTLKSSRKQRERTAFSRSSFLLPLPQPSSEKLNPGYHNIVQAAQGGTRAPGRTSCHSQPLRVSHVSRLNVNNLLTVPPVELGDAQRLGCLLLAPPSALSYFVLQAATVHGKGLLSPPRCPSCVLA